MSVDAMENFRTGIHTGYGWDLGVVVPQDFELIDTKACVFRELHISNPKSREKQEF